jgi:hypothetical protein
MRQVHSAATQRHDLGPSSIEPRHLGDEPGDLTGATCAHRPLAARALAARNADALPEPIRRIRADRELCFARSQAVH